MGAVLTCAATVARAEAANVTVAVDRAPGVVVIKATALLRTDMPMAWGTLTDYDRYAEFIPGLRSSRVVRRRGNDVTVEQSGDAAWPWPIPLRVSYEIAETPRTRIQSHATAGLLRALDSTYELVPADQGIRLDYTGYLVTRSALFGVIDRYAFQQNVDRQFKALADEIERRSAAEH